MLEMQATDWAALAGVKDRREMPATEVLEKLSYYGLVVRTPRGVLMVSGAGGDALTLFRHGLKPTLVAPQAAEEQAEDDEAELGDETPFSEEETA